MLVCAFAVNAQLFPSKAVDKPTLPLIAPKAQAAEPVEIKLTRRKVSVTGTKETFQDALTAKPGDVFEETAAYTNKSMITVTKLEATLPIPLNTELIANSTRPANVAVRASTDGTNFRALPLKRKVKQANGVEIEQVVPLNEYRFLRWYPGELAAGKSLTYSARFKIADDAPAANNSK